MGRPPRRRSILQRLLTLPLWMAYALLSMAVGIVVFVSRFVPGSLQLLLLALVPVFIFTQPWVNDLWKGMMIAAALMLAFAAGALRRSNR